MFVYLLFYPFKSFESFNHKEQLRNKVFHLYNTSDPTRLHTSYKFSVKKYVTDSENRIKPVAWFRRS